MILEIAHFERRRAPLFIIDHSSQTPIYEQIKRQILALVSAGVLKEGDKLPSLRVLSSELHLNINTVKKVFSELEADGVITTVVGSGSYLSATAYRNPAVISKAQNDLSCAALAALSYGMTEEEIIETVKKACLKGDLK